MRDGAALLGHLLPPDQFSFPLGPHHHGLRGCGCAGGFYPAMPPGLFFCAASVAASRIVLGMHFLSDVLAGAVLGAVLGAVSAGLFR